MKKELRKIVVIGGCVRFQYARHNFVGLDQQQEVRRVRITAIRDIRIDPLDEETFTLRPTLLRGRYLITGEDLDKGVERTFYLERMSDIEKIAESDGLKRSLFHVLEQNRIAFTTEDLSEAMAFRLGRRGGAIYGRVAAEFSPVVSHVFPSPKEKRKTA
jgi:hypothetical protein